MHIEPGVVDGAKIALSYVTGAGAALYAAKNAWTAMIEKGVGSLIARSAITTGLVFSFFQILPHHPVGVSEVHFILGSTLFLLFGMAPAAIGLALGLLAQGMFFEPIDLPQYGMNLTTLLVPLFALKAIADRIIAPGTAYVDLKYSQALALSTTYQGGIVAWVAFWVFYGNGFTVETFTAVSTFGAAYMVVIMAEPLIDLAVLAGAKSMKGLKDSGLVTPRLHAAA